MSLNTVTNQTIALAGIAQAAALVEQLSTSGNADMDAVQSSIGSILKIDSDSIEDIYGGLKGVQLGLEQLERQLTGNNISNPQQARYSASLVFLEKRLSTDKKMLQAIHAGIEKAQAQAEHFGPLHENVLANLGDLYHSTISTMKPRIIINGEQVYLSNQDIVYKIRSLLLAGIRSTILWRQCGGSRWKFLFFRKKLQDEVRRLINTL